MSEEDTSFEFPCQFPIKAIGHNVANFEALVVAIICKHAKGITEGAVKVRPSRGDKFLGVTVTIEAQSKRQLDAIYQDLNDCPEVRMVM